MVGEIQKAYNAYAGILRREADEAYDTSEKLKGGPLVMSKDHEWNRFTQNNSQMVDPRIELRQLNDIVYPGKDNPLAIDVRSGMLERKSKYLRNYQPGWFVVHTRFINSVLTYDTGMCYHLRIFTSSNQPTVLLRKPRCFRCSFQNKNWVSTRKLMATLTNSF